MIVWLPQIDTGKKLFVWCEEGLTGWGLAWTGPVSWCLVWSDCTSLCLLVRLRVRKEVEYRFYFPPSAMASVAEWARSFICFYWLWVQTCWNQYCLFNNFPSDTRRSWLLSPQLTKEICHSNLLHLSSLIYMNFSGSGYRTWLSILFTTLLYYTIIYSTIYEKASSTSLFRRCKWYAPATLSALIESTLCSLSSPAQESWLSWV